MERAFAEFHVEGIFTLEDRTASLSQAGVGKILDMKWIILSFEKGRDPVHPKVKLLSWSAPSTGQQRRVSVN